MGPKLFAQAPTIDEKEAVQSYARFTSDPGTKYKDTANIRYINRSQFAKKDGGGLEKRWHVISVKKDSFDKANAAQIRELIKIAETAKNEKEAIAVMRQVIRTETVKPEAAPPAEKSKKDWEKEQAPPVLVPKPGPDMTKQREKEELARKEKELLGKINDAKGLERIADKTAELTERLRQYGVVSASLTEAKMSDNKKISDEANKIVARVNNNAGDAIMKVANALDRDGKYQEAVDLILNKRAMDYYGVAEENKKANDAMKKVDALRGKIDAERKAKEKKKEKPKEEPAPAKKEEPKPVEKPPKAVEKPVPKPEVLVLTPEKEAAEAVVKVAMLRKEGKEEEAKKHYENAIQKYIEAYDNNKENNVKKAVEYGYLARKTEKEYNRFCGARFSANIFMGMPSEADLVALGKGTTKPKETGEKAAPQKEAAAGIMKNFAYAEEGGKIVVTYSSNGKSGSNTKTELPAGMDSYLLSAITSGKVTREEIKAEFKRLDKENKKTVSDATVNTLANIIRQMQSEAYYEWALKTGGSVPVAELAAGWEKFKGTQIKVVSENEFNDLAQRGMGAGLDPKTPIKFLAYASLKGGEQKDKLLIVPIRVTFDFTLDDLTGAYMKYQMGDKKKHFWESMIMDLNLGKMSLANSAEQAKIKKKYGGEVVIKNADTSTWNNLNSSARRKYTGAEGDLSTSSLTLPVITVK